MGHVRRIVVGGVIATVVVSGTALAAGVTGTFTGKTTQGKHVRLIVKQGAIKRGSKLPYALSCKHGGTLGGTMVIYGPIRHHRFAVTTRDTESVGNGYRARSSSSLKIVVGSRHAHGAFGAFATVLNRKGRVVDHCAALLTFTASR
jgi:hypothetical protein